MSAENSIDFVIYDCFAHEYVLSRDPYAPPERYLTFARGCHAIIEHWLVDQNGNEMVLDIAYSPENYHDAEFQKREREAMLEKNHCTIKMLRCLTIPEKDFEAILRNQYIHGG